MDRFKVPLMWLPSLILLASCSSEEIRTEPNPYAPAPETVTLRFKLGANTFTRADEVGNDVENFQLVFYSFNNGSPLFLQKVSAVKESEDGIYSADIEIIPNKEPDIFMAFVNAPENADLSSLIEGDPVLLEDIQTNKGNLIMSTPRYFDKTNKDIFYQTFDYTTEEPINIEVERVAAKINVTKSYDSSAFPAVSMYDAEGNNINLKLNLTGWGVNATDKGSYLLRKIGSYSEMQSELSAWSDWNDSQRNSLNWSMSLNYSTDFSDLSSLDKIKLIKFSEINNSFGSDVFAHESTRSSTAVTNGLNSKPSILMSGYYTIENSPATTFYRVQNSIFLEDEIWSYFNKRISGKILIKGAAPTVEETKRVFSLQHVNQKDGKDLPSSFMSLQLSNASLLSEISSKDSNFSDLTSLNEFLIKICGITEIFKDGKCLFSVPIEHQKLGNDILYGLVRNHYYKVSINQISGIGSGLIDDDQVITEEPSYEGEDTEYKISFTLTIREWTDVIQNVVIKKD